MRRRLPTLEKRVRRTLAEEWLAGAKAAERDSYLAATVGDVSMAEEHRIAARLLREHAKLVEGGNV
jgi:hypothetical protein